MRLVLFKVNHLGDNVVFLPVVQAIRRLRPDWRLTVITAAPERPLYLADVPGERIWTPPDRLSFHHAWRRPWVWAGWLARLRRERPDAILLSYDQCNSAHLLARCSGAPVRVGARQPFLKVRGSMTVEVARPASLKIVDWNWAMGRALFAALGEPGWPDAPPPPALGHLTGPEAARRERLVVIHAGARNEIRRWGAERMATVGAHLREDGWRVVWVGRPDAALPERARGLELRPCTSLAELAELLGRASLFLCNNSGPMHIASALGTPIVAVSGPSSRDWDPYWHADRHRILRMPGLACIACEDSGVGTERCANLAAPSICLHHWTVDAVTGVCREVLARNRPDAAGGTP